METNFFKSILSLHVAVNWKINIAKETDDKLIVSVLFFNDDIGDDARKKVPPILLKGTPDELDNGFFEAITEPVQIRQSFLPIWNSSSKKRNKQK